MMMTTTQSLTLSNNISPSTKPSPQYLTLPTYNNSTGIKIETTAIKQSALISYLYNKLNIE